MPLPFPATLRALDCDSRGRFGHRALVLLPPAALLGLWLTWSLRAEIPVTADSTAATLQTARMFVIESPADGVVAASGLRLGRRVRAGELLLALDDRDLLARLAALRDRRGALAAAAAALAAAFLNAAFGFCLGCEMYLLMKRLRPGRQGMADPESDKEVAA